MGNRIHIINKLAGLYYVYKVEFCAFFLRDDISNKLLTKSISTDFQKIEAQDQLCVLGLVGIMLTGPWMSYFYISMRHHLEDFVLLKKVISILKECIATPIKMLRLEVDFFGNPLYLNDHIILILEELTLPVVSLK